MYTLQSTDGYDRALEALDDGQGTLTAMLERSVYHALRRDPRVGLPSWSPGLWVIRQTVVGGLLNVRILYEFDDYLGTVTLLSIQRVDMLNP